MRTLNEWRLSNVYIMDKMKLSPIFYASFDYPLYVWLCM